MSGLSCSVSSNLRRTHRTTDFCTIAKSILGPDYELSIVLVGDRYAQRLNQEYRQKNTAANVLSFPLAATRGEIYLNMARIYREAHKFLLSPEGHARYLLIHGCLHLKGYDHGGTMDEAERKFLKKFSIR